VATGQNRRTFDVTSGRSDLSSLGVSLTVSRWIGALSILELNLCDNFAVRASQASFCPSAIGTESSRMRAPLRQRLSPSSSSRP